MGVHIGLVAVEASVAQLRSAFSELWPTLEIASTADGFRSRDEIWAWRAAHVRNVTLADAADDSGTEVYVFCQDGPWALLLDFSYVLASDEAALRQLSARFGRALSFIVETTSSCADFWCCEAGQVRRTIHSSDGVLTMSGAPLPEERGIAAGRYDEDDTDALLQAFGLSVLAELPSSATALAISTVDRTDYGALRATFAAPRSVATRKPWWKFW